MGKRLLIISNNVLSTTYNNGKTIYSLIQSWPVQNVAQLYFNSSPPEILGYDYFRLSDRDVLKGQLRPSLRGGKVEALPSQSDHNVFQPNNEIPRNNFTLSLRELIWHNAWKSRQLDEWLNEFKPDTVFFVAGDCLFAYRICAYIVNKYQTGLHVYVTDDYVLPRYKENFLGKNRRKKIFELMRKCVKRSDTFFTISERMRQEYKALYGKDSVCIFNCSKSMRNEEICGKADENSTVIFTYAGSLYYGRDDVLWNLSLAIERFNKEHPNLKKVQLDIYSNSNPSKDFLFKVDSINCVNFLGGLNQVELREKLNLSNMLVFVESFEPEQIEKTRLSFSTKIPEYMSLGKPILAIGPKNIGSMDYLADVAVCAYREIDIYDMLVRLVTLTDMQRMCSKRVLEKYNQSIHILSQCCKMLI